MTAAKPSSRPSASAMWTRAASAATVVFFLGCSMAPSGVSSSESGPVSSRDSADVPEVGSPIPLDASPLSRVTESVLRSGCSVVSHSVTRAGVQFVVTEAVGATPPTVCGVYARDPAFRTAEGVGVGTARATVARYGEPRSALGGTLGGDRPDVFALPSGWLAVVEPGPVGAVALLARERAGGGFPDSE